MNNIDWPSTNTLSTAQQKAELVAMLDHAMRLKLNAIVLQVRPACDALYASKLEPWSEYLTGRMGQAPDPFYDPLLFAIEQAHKRGLQLHAWFNPYRAQHSSAKSALAKTHISRTHPDLVRRYGKQLWLDPGEKAVQDYSLAVVMDVVNRYDIDGVHFDDYFYPYTETDANGRELDFPDEASWRKSGVGEGLSRADWRRKNVDAFIRRANTAVKSAKPWVKFGVSPFGIWRPGYPPQVKGYDAYEKLYADSRTWLMNGWLDYLAPQLYWGIQSQGQSFPALLEWWCAQNPKGRYVWPGLNTCNVGRGWKPEEIAGQIRLTRRAPAATGQIHWSMRGGLMHRNGVEPVLRDLYGGPALVPGCPWVKSSPPSKPRLTAVSRSPGVRLSWRSPGGAKPSVWVLQTRDGTGWTTEILPGSMTSYVLKKMRPQVIAVSAVDRYGNLGAASSMQLE